MTNCYSYCEGSETFSDEQIQDISKSISDAVENELIQSLELESTLNPSYSESKQ